MRADFSERFRKSYENAPLYIQRIFDKKLNFLLRSLHHPSLHAKKYDESRNIWQARATKTWRFYFRINSDIYELTDLIKHPK